MAEYYLADLRALEASLIAKLQDINWENCRDSLRDELREVRTQMSELRWQCASLAS